MKLFNSMILSVSMIMSVNHWVMPYWSAIPVRSSWMRWLTIIPLLLWQWALITIHLTSAHSITITLVPWYHSSRNHQIYQVVYKIKVMIWLINKNRLSNILLLHSLRIVFLSIFYKKIAGKWPPWNPLQDWLAPSTKMSKRKVWWKMIKFWSLSPPILKSKKGNRLSPLTIT